MKILISLSSEVYVAHVPAKKNATTAEIQDDINNACASTKHTVIIESLPKSMRQADKTFTLKGDIGSLTMVIAAYFDTDPDRSQLEWDWNVKFVKVD